MTKNINIISTLASKAGAQTEKYLFEGFCELLTRVFHAFEDEEWAHETGWDIAFGSPGSNADESWKLVARQADELTAIAPLSSNGLVLRRMAGLIKRAVSASTVEAICDLHAKAMQCRSESSSMVAAAVHDLAMEAESCIEQMFEHAEAYESYGIDDGILPLAA